MNAVKATQGAFRLLYKNIECTPITVYANQALEGPELLRTARERGNMEINGNMAATDKFDEFSCAFAQWTTVGLHY